MITRFGWGASRPLVSLINDTRTITAVPTYSRVASLQHYGPARPSNNAAVKIHLGRDWVQVFCCCRTESGFLQRRPKRASSIRRGDTCETDYARCICETHARSFNLAVGIRRLVWIGFASSFRPCRSHYSLCISGSCTDFFPARVSEMEVFNLELFFTCSSGSETLCS